MFELGLGRTLRLGRIEYSSLEQLFRILSWIPPIYDTKNGIANFKEL